MSTVKQIIELTYLPAYLLHFLQYIFATLQRYADKRKNMTTVSSMSFSETLCVTTDDLERLHFERVCYRIPAELFEMELHRPKDFEVGRFS